MKARSIKQLEQWAYFSPDGHIQVRTICDTRKHSREMICATDNVTYKDYEKAGYFVKKIIIDIKVYN